jgi:hypothetical protein
VGSGLQAGERDVDRLGRGCVALTLAGGIVHLHGEEAGRGCDQPVGRIGHGRLLHTVALSPRHLGQHVDDLGHAAGVAQVAADTSLAPLHGDGGGVRVRPDLGGARVHDASGRREGSRRVVEGQVVVVLEPVLGDPDGRDPGPGGDRLLGHAGEQVADGDGADQEDDHGDHHLDQAEALVSRSQPAAVSVAALAPVAAVAAVAAVNAGARWARSIAAAPRALRCLGVAAVRSEWAHRPVPSASRGFPYSEIAASRWGERARSDPDR